MSGRPLQQTGYRASDYERPNDRWACGQAACGEPCPFGPSSKGACGWTCTPRDVAGSLECGRPGKDQCQTGPTRDAKGGPQCCQVACQPTPSIRRQRGLLSAGAVLLTMAVLGLSMASKATREAIVSPGGLSSHHAALACSECHTAAVASETPSWTLAALQRQHVSEKVDSAKCAACHRLEGPAWRYAHTLDASSEDPERATLAKLQARSIGQWEGDPQRPQPGAVLKGAAWLAGHMGQRDEEGRYKVEHELDCLLCHGEHRGATASLQRDVPEHRCTVCHTVGFDSFNGDHPEFANFGQRLLPGNLIFTHGAHYEGYGLAPKDEHGQVDLSRGAACSSCHESDAGGRHMKVKARTYETECLRCHQATADPIAVLQAPSGPELAWLGEMTKRPYLPRLADPTEAPSLFAPFLRGLSEDPQELREDIVELRGIHNGLLELAPVDEDGDEAFSEGDLIGPPELKPLRKWLEAQSEREGLSEEETARIEEAQALIKGLERSRKSLARALKKEGSKSTKARVERVQEYGRRLRGLVAAFAQGKLERLRESLGLPESAKLQALAAVFPKAQLGAFEAAWFDPQGSTATRTLKLEPAREALSAWQGGGRLVASDALGGLRYEGYTHLDPFLKELMELAPQASPAAQRQLHAVLAERCAKCHALAPSAADAKEARSMVVQWQAMLDPPEAERRLTHFAHEAHLGLASCTECHQLRPTLAPEERRGTDFEIAARWRQIGASGVAQSGCRECHTPQAYGAGCQLCHDYHAGSLTPGAGTRPPAPPAAPGAAHK